MILNINLKVFKIIIFGENKIKVARSNSFRDSNKLVNLGINNKNNYAISHDRRKINFQSAPNNRLKLFLFTSTFF